MAERDDAIEVLRVDRLHAEPLALLHYTQMSPELRADLNNKEVEVGEEIFVQVIRTDAERGRVTLKEIPEPDEPAVSAAA